MAVLYSYRQKGSGSLTPPTNYVVTTSVTTQEPLCDTLHLALPIDDL